MHIDIVVVVERALPVGILAYFIIALKSLDEVEHRQPSVYTFDTTFFVVYGYHLRPLGNPEFRKRGQILRDRIQTSLISDLNDSAALDVKDHTAVDHSTRRTQLDRGLDFQLVVRCIYVRIRLRDAAVE